MVILHAAHSYPPEVSGVGEVVAQVSVRLARRGHDVHLATGWPTRTRAAEVLQGVTVHRFAVRGNAVEGMRGEVQRYVEFVRGFAADVLVLHCAQVWTLDALLPHLHKLPAARIFVGHGLSALEHPAYREYFSELGAALRHVDRVVALSPLLEERPFCSEHGLREPVIIANGVNPALWRGASAKVRQRWRIGQRPWLLSVSNHSPVKGHDRLFEVFRQLRREVRDARATIIGDPYPAEKWQLGRIGVRGGCWHRCRLRAAITPGLSLRWNVPRPEVISAIQEADLVMVTSSREASPLVVLESMAAGTPWLSFDVGCVREHVGGVVVRDSEEMASAAAFLLRDAQARSRLGQEGRQRAKERHDWDIIARQYEQVYAEAVTLRAAQAEPALTGVG